MRPLPSHHIAVETKSPRVKSWGLFVDAPRGAWPLPPAKAVSRPFLPTLGTRDRCLHIHVGSRSCSTLASNPGWPRLAGRPPIVLVEDHGGPFEIIRLSVHPRQTGSRTGPPGRRRSTPRRRPCTPRGTGDRVVGKVPPPPPPVWPYSGVRFSAVISLSSRAWSSTGADAVSVTGGGAVTASVGVGVTTR